VLERITVGRAVPVTLFPFELPEDVKASNMFLGPFRLGAPTLFGGTGVELRSQNRVRIVAFEWPAEYAPVSDKAAKNDNTSTASMWTIELERATQPTPL
jgi:hypothetical protein